MITVNIITNDNKAHELGIVNQTTIYNKIQSVDVLKDGNTIYQYKFKKGEIPLIRKRSNADLGAIYIVGYHKNKMQNLTFIDSNGDIITHGDRVKDSLGNYHVFHSDVELMGHEV